MRLRCESAEEGRHQPRTHSHPSRLGDHAELWRGRPRQGTRRLSSGNPLTRTDSSVGLPRLEAGGRPLHQKVVQIWTDSTECELFEHSAIEIYDCDLHDGTDDIYRDIDGDGFYATEETATMTTPSSVQKPPKSAMTWTMTATG